MKYFWMKQECIIGNDVSIPLFTQEELLSDNPIIKQIIISEEKKESVFLDFLIIKARQKSHHLVSDRLKQVFMMYLPQIMVWRPLAFADQHQSVHLYWFLTPPKVEGAISDQTEYGFDQSVTELVLNKSKVEDQCVFCIETKMQRMIILRLDAAESLLRRGFYGIDLNKVKLEE